MHVHKRDVMSEKQRHRQENLNTSDVDLLSHTQQVADTERELQLLSVDASSSVVGDFNNTDLRSCLTSIEQNVTCLIRKDKTIDLCYRNIPRTFRSFALPPIGNSDHNTVHLRPVYRPRCRQTK